MIIKISIILFICLIFFWKDISNYIFIRKCFTLACNDDFINSNYKGIKRTFLNVLYFYIVVQSNIDDERLDILIKNKLAIIDDFLVALSLDGVILLEIRPMGEINEGNDNLYLIKFVQTVKKFKSKLFVSSVVSIIMILVIDNFDLLYDIWKTTILK